MAAVASSTSETTPVGLDERLDAVTSFYAQRDLFSGTVLVASGDDIVFTRAYGKADVSQDIDNDLDTIYRIGSVAKQFTAAIALRMVEAGTLDIEAPITTYLPDYPRPQGDRITLHMLLSHTSGIPSYTALPMYQHNKARPEPPQQFIEKFASLDLEFEPGSRFQYSNSGYYLLGVILERVAGRDLATLLRTELLDPLELHDTGYDDAPLAGQRRARGYTWNGETHEPETPVDPSKIFAAGMMYSTAKDLLRWTRALHAGTPFREADTHLAMTELPAGKDSNYQFGLGIVTRDIAGRSRVGAGHGGGLEGFQSSVVYIPDEQWTVVVLCNSGDEVGPLADSLMSTLAGGPPDPPVVPLSREFGRLVRERGLAAAQAWLREISSSGAVRLSVDAQALNELGDLYLSRDEGDHAVAVFEIVVEVFPQSAAAFGRLGEALLATNDEARALQNFDKALELDPSNEDVAAVVQRLRATAR